MGRPVHVGGTYRAGGVSLAVSNVRRKFFENRIQDVLGQLVIGEWVGVGALPVEFFFREFGGFVVSVCFAVVFAFLALVGIFW